MLNCNPRKFWQQLSPASAVTDITLKGKNQLPLPRDQCASAFNTFFSSVFTREDHSSIPEFPELDYPFMAPVDINIEGIIKLINNLKVSTSSGLDNINSKILKNTIPTSSQILFHIFRQSLCTGQLPRDWKVAKVIPIFKAGCKDQVENYRPISLTSISCKLLEHIIASHIYSHLESNDFFSSTQHGFRKGFSCDTQLLEFTTDLQTNLDMNTQTDCAFLDFSKAFDRVAHCRLISKLSSLKLDSLTLSWLRNFLSFREQLTFANDSHSDIAEVTSGVPQGSVLGPLLFLIFINDLPTNISSRIRLFADDCVIYRTITSSSDHEALQGDLDLVCSWCNKWLMSLNTSKCKIMSVSRKTSISTFSYKIKNSEVSRTTSYKYLGVIIDSKLSWSSHITSICSKASKTLGYLRRNLHYSTSSVRKIAYLTFVRPQLEYASPVWSPYQHYLIQMIEAIQNRAARFITQNYQCHSSVSQIKREIGLQPLDIRRKIALLVLFHKYISSRNPCAFPLHTPDRMSARMRNQRSFKRIFGRTRAFNLSALPQAISLWNDLPDVIVSVTNNNAFREKLLSHYI